MYAWYSRYFRYIRTCKRVLPWILHNSMVTPKWFWSFQSTNVTPPSPQRNKRCDSFELRDNTDNKRRISIFLDSHVAARDMRDDKYIRTTKVYIYVYMYVYIYCMYIYIYIYVYNVYSTTTITATPLYIYIYAYGCCQRGITWARAMVTMVTGGWPDSLPIPLHLFYPSVGARQLHRRRRT